MPKLQIKSVSISWGVSRGRDTYGYNICRAVSRETGKTYRTCGGGYDMVGTVLGEYFAAEYQNDLQALVSKDSSKLQPYTACSQSHADLYGLFVRPDGTAYINGVYGVGEVICIIEACGYDVQRQYDPRSKSRATTGYLISKVVEE